MGKLVLQLPDGSTREIALKRERVTIGRHVDNDVCLPVPAVSAKHAAVVTIDGDSFLEDLGSRNGTLVNGKTITKHFLRDNDEIDIGRQRLVYRSGLYETMLESARDESERRVPSQPAASIVDVRTNDSHVPVLQELPPAATKPLALIDTTALFAPAAPEATRDNAATNGTLEVLDGPLAGSVAAIDHDDFVLGRLGVQLASLRRDHDGLRVELVEGNVSLLLNDAPVPEAGALLAHDDELVVAGVRLRYRGSGAEGSTTPVGREK